MNERRNDLEIMSEAYKLLCRSQTRIDLLFTMSEIPHARPVGRDMRSDVSRTMIKRPVRRSSISSGGARRDRTDDLMLAKHALSQLSYGPVPEDECFYCARGALAFAGATAQQPSLKKACRAEAAAQRRLVGLGRLELPTSRLSSARSNQLSYKPLTLIL